MPLSGRQLLPSGSLDTSASRCTSPLSVSDIDSEPGSSDSSMWAQPSSWLQPADTIRGQRPAAFQGRESGAAFRDIDRGRPFPRLRLQPLAALQVPSDNAWASKARFLASDTETDRSCKTRLPSQSLSQSKSTGHIIDASRMLGHATPLSLAEGSRQRTLRRLHNRVALPKSPRANSRIRMPQLVPDTVSKHTSSYSTVQARSMSRSRSTGASGQAHLAVLGHPIVRAPKRCQGEGLKLALPLQASVGGA